VSTAAHGRGARAPAPVPARSRTRTAAGASATVLQFSADGDNQQLAHLTGALDGNIRQIETEYAVQIRRRGNVFRIEGGAEAARSAQALLPLRVQRQEIHHGRQ